MTATTAQIQVDALIGASVVVSRVKVSARIQVDQLIGAVSFQIGKPRSARLSVQAILGSPRLFAYTGDNPWVRYGLPLPLQDSYSYQPSEKLVRTQMLSGYTRQRRMWRDGFRQASVTLELTRTQLVSLEEFLDEIGGDWFKMPLVTGDNPSRVAVDHRVRVMGDHSVSDVDWQMVKVTLPVEIASRSCDFEIRLFADDWGGYVDRTELLTQDFYTLLFYMLYGDVYAAARYLNGNWVPIDKVSYSVETEGAFVWLYESANYDLGDGATGFLCINAEDVFSSLTGTLTITATVGSCEAQIVLGDTDDGSYYYDGSYY